MVASRRLFLVGVGASLVAAPAVVRAGSLMPLRGVVLRDRLVWVPQYRSCFDRVLNAPVDLLFGCDEEAQFHRVMRGEHERYKPIAPWVV
jgi:hypothetical protein